MGNLKLMRASSGSFCPRKSNKILDTISVEPPKSGSSYPKQVEA